MNPLTASGLFLMLLALLNWIRMPGYISWQRKVTLRDPTSESSRRATVVGRALSIGMGVIGVGLVVAGLLTGSQ